MNEGGISDLSTDNHPGMKRINGDVGALQKFSQAEGERDEKQFGAAIVHPSPEEVLALDVKGVNPDVTMPHGTHIDDAR